MSYEMQEACEAIEREEAEKELWAKVETFVKKHEITCPETIAQTDRVIEDAYDFIQGLCETVGYHKHEDQA